MTTSAIVSVNTPTGQLIDIKTGMATFPFTKWLQNIGQVINQAFDNQVTLSPNSIPYPTTTTLGGILASAEIIHEWVDSIDSNGAAHLSQPSFSDLTGSAIAGQLPSLSGLSGSVTPSQVPQLSQLAGSVTSSQVPTLDLLAGQITDVQLPSGLLGITVTIATAKLTVAGTNGSMSFINGILQAQVAAT